MGLVGQYPGKPKDLARDVNFWKIAMPCLPSPTIKCMFSHTY